MNSPYRYHILPCAGPRCGPETGAALKARLKELLPDRRDLKVRMSTSSCQGMCAIGPNVLVYPEGIAYHGVTLGDIDRIVEQHIRNGQPIDELMNADPPPPKSQD